MDFGALMELLLTFWQHKHSPLLKRIDRKSRRGTVGLKELIYIQRKKPSNSRKLMNQKPKVKHTLNRKKDIMYLDGSGISSADHDLTDMSWL